MPLNFPSSPTVGQVFGSYTWDGEKWKLTPPSDGGGGGDPPSDALPLMDGAAAAGVADEYSRGDHVHPSDTSKASVSYVDAGDAANASAITGKVAKAGDTMTGDLTITKSSATLILDNTGAAGSTISDVRLNRNGGRRWIMRSSSDAESGGNIGSNYVLLAYADDGVTHVGTPITVSRSDSRVTLWGDPISSLHAATKQYADTKLPKTGGDVGNLNILASGGEGGQISFYDNLNATQPLVLDVTDANNGRVMVTKNLAVGQLSGTGGALRFYTSGGERLTVTDTYVSVNTTTIATAYNAAALVVAGGLGVGGAIIANNYESTALISTNWQYRATSGHVIAANSSVLLQAGSGLIVVTSHSDGQSGLYLCGGGAVVLIAGNAAFFEAGTIPADNSSKRSLIYDAGSGAYRFHSKYSTSHTYGIMGLMTRPSP